MSKRSIVRLPRFDGQIGGAVIPAEHWDGVNPGIAFGFKAGNSAITRLKQLARSEKLDIAGPLSGSNGNIYGVSWTEASDKLLTALGVPRSKFNLASLAVDPEDHGSARRSLRRLVDDVGIDQHSFAIESLGLNCLSGEVYRRPFGRTMTDRNGQAHAEWQVAKGRINKGGVFPPAFLRSPGGREVWGLAGAVIVRALQTGDGWGRLPSSELERILDLGYEGREGSRVSGEEFREVIEGVAAEQIAKGHLKSRDSLEALSTNLPVIRERRGERVAHQQYSTPFAVGGVGADIFRPVDGTRVFEPTIGNGTLVAAFAGAGAFIEGVELEEGRAAIARRVFGESATIAQGDATDPSNMSGSKSGPVDLVVGNPPFGAAEPTTVNIRGVNFRCKRLETLIMGDAFNRLNEGGDAFVVMPANIQAPQTIEGHRREFHNLVHGIFDEVSCTALDGRLYGSMGTSVPVLVYALKGARAKARSLSEIAALTTEEVGICASYGEFFSWGDAVAARYDISREASKASVAPEVLVDPSPASGTSADVDHPAPIPSPGASSTGSNGRRVVSPTPIDAEIEVDETSDGITPPDDTFGPMGLGLVDDFSPNPFTRPYVPFSRVGDGSTVIQKSLEAGVYSSLMKVQAARGDVDVFVASKLGGDLSALEERFSPEQVDALALTFHRWDSGDDAAGHAAGILGDKMGVGKGRTLAAMSLAAMKEGRAVVFMTTNPMLFSDFAVRDFHHASGKQLSAHIADGDVRPFIFNSGPKAALRSASGLIHVTSEDERNSARDSGLHRDTNLVMLSYSQLQTKSGHWRLQAIRDWVAKQDKAPLILTDEAHRAAGRDSRSGLWTQLIVDDISEAGGIVEYSSATSLKSGKNIDLYKAALPDTGLSMSKLITLIESNPLAMQETLASEMASNGQIVERSLDSAGVRRELERLVDLDPHKMAVAREKVDAASEFLSEMIEKSVEFRVLAREVAKVRHAGSIAHDGQATVDVTTTSPVSQFDHYSRYLMLAVNGLFVEDLLSQSIARGEKPCVVVENTGDALIDWRLGATPSSTGIQPINSHITIGDVLKKNASKLVEFSVIDGFGQKHRERLPDGGWLERFNERIDDADFSELRINVLDRAREASENLGLKFADITGRKFEIVSEGTSLGVRQREEPDRAARIADYNNGDLDVIALNRGASTGISMQSSPSVGADIRVRSMIKLQLQRDVTDERQIDGRIDRYGQVSAPVYYIPMTGFAADDRLAMLFNNKNRSLSSSTSATRDNAANLEHATDLMNPVGEMAVTRFLIENPEIAISLDIDLKAGGSGMVRKLLGRLVCLPIEMQETTLSEIDSIFMLTVDELDAEGINPLRLAQHEWKASVETIRVLRNGDLNSDSVVDKPVLLNEVSYDVSINPRRFAEIHDQAQAYMQSHAGAIGRYETPRELVGTIVGKDGGIDWNSSLFDSALGRTETGLFATKEISAAAAKGAWDARNVKPDEDSDEQAVPQALIGRISAVGERALFLDSVLDHLRVGNLVSISGAALPESSHGRYTGRALREGLDQHLVPAIITSVRVPSDPTRISDWTIGIATPGDKVKLSFALSALRTRWESLEDRPGHAPISDIVNWNSQLQSRADDYRNLVSSIYGEESAGAIREIVDHGFPRHNAGDDLTQRNAAQYHLGQALFDLVPAGVTKETRYTLEGNLFAALALSQSGHSRLGEKAVYLDDEGVRRHAVVLHPRSAELLRETVEQRADAFAEVRSELRDAALVEATVGLMDDLTAQYGGEHDAEQVIDRCRSNLCKLFPDDLPQQRGETVQAFKDRVGRIDEALVRACSSAMTSRVPPSILVGGDPWDGALDPEATDVARGRTVSLINSNPGSVKSLGVYVAAKLDKMRDLIPGLGRQGVGVILDSHGCHLFWHPENAALKETDEGSELIARSTNKSGSILLKGGFLSADLDPAADARLIGTVVSMVAKHLGDDVLISGGLKQVFEVADTFVESLRKERAPGSQRMLEREAIREEGSPALV